jgi:Zn-dependent peptidase ImmA (M78 family)/DNA-binding XRE family transcriptional regulator
VTGVPVSPEVLQWARDYRRLSEQDAATKLGVTVEYLRALENGDETPNLTMFEKIAAQYQLPQSTLFRQTRPKNPPEPTDYRTLGGERPNKTFELSVAVGRARALLTQLQRVADDDAEYRPPALPHLRITGQASELGELERERLGVDFADQKKWRSAAEAFRQWRRLIERQGVNVFMEKFPLADCRGFTLDDAGRPPCIVVNRDEEFDVARIYTLVHEYCHLLIRKPGISDENPANPVEAFCNRFAAGFLMPKKALRQLLPYWPNEPVDWAGSEVAEWAKQLKVSRRALAIRLEALGVAPQGFNKQFVYMPPVAKNKREGDIKIPGDVTRLNEVGSNYARVVISAFDRKVITLADAAEAFGLTPRQIDAVREAITPRGNAGV